MLLREIDQAMLDAAALGHLGKLVDALGDGACADACDAEKTTAAMYAAWNGHWACLWVLARRNADFNLRNKRGGTALICTALRGHAPSMGLLIAGKAELDSKDKDGMSALALSAKLGHEKCVDLLLDAGADLNLRGAGGMTPSMEAALAGQIGCLRRLMKAGALLDFKNDKGVGTAELAAKWNFDIEAFIELDGERRSLIAVLESPQLEDGVQCSNDGKGG